MKFESVSTATLFAVMLATLMLVSVQASPRIRAMRHFQAVTKRNGSSSGSSSYSQPSCHESLICGFAYYDTSRSRIRPIISYRKNNLCSCDDGYRCVLTGNMSDRKAYVFHCRDREKSGHMYEFPQSAYGR